MRGLFAPVMCALLVTFCVALFVPTTSATAAHDGDHPANETAHADAGHAEPEPTPESEPEPTTGDHEGSGEHEPNAETEPQPKTDKAAQAADEEAENGGSHGHKGAAKKDTASLSHISALEHSIDEFFIVTMSIIIFFMQAGFAFMEAGSVRSKNTTNILIKNLLDCLIGGIAYWLIGFPLAFGKEGNGFIGWSYWAGAGLPDDKLGHWFFDFVHAATASTLVSGSMAERCNFYAYLSYSFLITGFIYPVASHWVWSPHGWLHSTPYQDYAGGGVVHMTGGAVALVGAAIMGPRIGRFHRKTGKALDIKGHSVPLTALGGFILLFGFMAFAAGFQGHISKEGDGTVISTAIVNSLLGACGGGVGALVIHRAGTFGPTHSWSFLMTLNGALCGMVSCCAGANVFYQWSALLVGLIGGFVYLCLHFLLTKARVDDPLDAFPVHFGGGFWGLIAVALFQRKKGIMFDASYANVMILAWNMIGASAILGWVMGLCILMFSLFKFFNILRVSEEMELRGLDLVKHNEPAYPISAWEECDPGPNSAYSIAQNLSKILNSDKAAELPTSKPSFAGPQQKVYQRRPSLLDALNSVAVERAGETLAEIAHTSMDEAARKAHLELNESRNTEDSFVTSKSSNSLHLPETPEFSHKSILENESAAGSQIKVRINGVGYE